MGTWACAGVTMIASALNSALTYGDLGDNRLLGLGTGVAVDVGLAVGLIGDRRLAAYGLSTPWGRALRITTAAMSLTFNTAISIRDEHYLLALLHAFLPILLIILCEYGQSVLLTFGTLTRTAPDREPVRVPPQSAQAIHEPLQASTADRFTPIRDGSPVLTPAATTTPAIMEPPPVPVGTAGQPLPTTQPVRTGTGPDREPQPVPDRSDDELIEAIRQLTDQSGTPPTARAVRQTLRVGHHRARRLIDQATPVPATNGGPR
jgi:hypothetical protein